MLGAPSRLPWGADRSNKGSGLASSLPRPGLSEASIQVPKTGYAEKRKTTTGKKNSPQWTFTFKPSATANFPNLRTSI